MKRSYAFPLLIGVNLIIYLLVGYLLLEIVYQRDASMLANMGAVILYYALSGIGANAYVNKHKLKLPLKYVVLAHVISITMLFIASIAFVSYALSTIKYF